MKNWHCSSGRLLIFEKKLPAGRGLEPLMERRNIVKWVTSHYVQCQEQAEHQVVRCCMNPYRLLAMMGEGQKRLKISAEIRKRMDNND
jgi:hypothetical protein